ncbi:histidine phosphatase family protein [Paracoccus sp. S-4012]|uniref:histidine phosphatase family protein n=1 Tax=Paracoccus sp. S-4012 TaxID=2665648 RepID=UPI0012B0C4C3|nr:histidine phosphatase family protein [Paracoccus sp. S-4012]MRX51114.1 histidine phosphatase family protein [Paracoccus sp. S-4012]
MTPRWPERLWIVRHGQSAGNVARDLAHEQGHHRIALSGRDVDVPLSELGRQQALALGHWFARGEEGARPNVILASPYLRACATAELFREGGGAVPRARIHLDERLREKEFGILDGWTTAGIRAEMPEQAEFRQMLGKFYHRPPGGESWCDVIFRLRSLLDTVGLHYGGCRVMIVAHQVVVLCMRYIIEGMTEAEILAIDAEKDVANCGVTEYAFAETEDGAGEMQLVAYNVTAPMKAEATPVTRAPDPIVASRG